VGEEAECSDDTPPPLAMSTISLSRRMRVLRRCISPLLSATFLPLQMLLSLSTGNGGRCHLHRSRPPSVPLTHPQNNKIALRFPSSNFVPAPIFLKFQAGLQPPSSALPSGDPLSTHETESEGSWALPGQSPPCEADGAIGIFGVCNVALRQRDVWGWDAYKMWCKGSGEGKTAEGKQPVTDNTSITNLLDWWVGGSLFEGLV